MLFWLNLLSAFADTCCFTGKVTQIVEFCTANNTATCNFDFFDSGAVQRESSFYAYTVGNTAYGKGFTNTAAAACDYNAFKHLNAFTAAFNYLYINFYSVACTKIRDVGANTSQRTVRFTQMLLYHSLH